MAFFETGKIEKLYIEAYEDDRYQNKVPGTDKFVVQVNPETITRKFAIEYLDQRNPSTGQNAKYFRTRQEEFRIDILFDATGVVKDSGLFNIAIANPFATQDNDLTAQITLFKNYCYNVAGSTHRPYFIKIYYGTEDITFSGVLQTLDIDYKLFTPEGKPLRAIAHMGLISSLNPIDAALLADMQSPDITHQKTFKAGTHFTILSNDTYKDVNRYIDVAKANRMLSFRKIENGRVINFPPIK